MFIVFTSWSDSAFAGSDRSTLTVTDSVGNRVAVWRVMDGVDFDVLASIYRANEGWSRPENISANFGRYPRNLKIFKNNTDGILVTWVDRHPELNANCLCASILKSGDTKWETSIISSLNDIMDENYDVFIDDSNHIDVVWTCRISKTKAIVRHVQTILGSDSWSIPQTISQ